LTDRLIERLIAGYRGALPGIARDRQLSRRIGNDHPALLALLASLASRASAAHRMVSLRIVKHRAALTDIASDDRASVTIGGRGRASRAIAPHDQPSLLMVRHSHPSFPTAEKADLLHNPRTGLACVFDLLR
jgi:hypothetical protein